MGAAGFNGWKSVAQIYSIMTVDISETHKSVQALQNKNAAAQHQLDYVNAELMQNKGNNNQIDGLVQKVGKWLKMASTKERAEIVTLIVTKSLFKPIRLNLPELIKFVSRSILRKRTPKTTCLNNWWGFLISMRSFACQNPVMIFWQNIITSTSFSSLKWTHVLCYL